MNTIETLLATDLTEEEVERLRDLVARGPLQEKPVDKRLLELKWISHYQMLEGPQNVVDTEAHPFNDTASLLREYTRRRKLFAGTECPNCGAAKRDGEMHGCGV